MKRLQAAVAALALAACTSVSAAVTVDVTWIAGAFNPAGGVDVGTISSPAGSTGANAGRFQGAVSNLNGIGAGAFYQSVNTMFAYCHDLDQTLSGGQTITYTVVPGASLAVRQFLGAVNAYIAGGDDFDWLNIGANANLGAAIQIGIWKGMYNDQWALGGLSSVTFSNLSANVTNIYNAILGFLGADPLASSRVMLLTSARRQDVITGRIEEDFDVPEPASLALLGVAIAAAGLARRRRR